MQSVDTTLYNFQNYLLGVTTKFSFKPAKMDETEKSNQAMKIFRWVIEDMLEWTPQEAKDHFGDKEIEFFKLKNILKDVIYPKNIRKKNYPYLISLLYPDEIQYDATEGVIEQWDDILAHSNRRFPGNIFDDENGKEIAYTLLEEFNKRYIPASSIEELYKIYSNSGYINNLLRDAKLYISFSKLCTYPITLLHEMLKTRYPGEEDSFLYTIYILKNIEDNVHLNKTKRKKKKNAE